MKNRIIASFSFLLLAGCTKHTLDLSKVDFNQDSSLYLNELDIYSKTEQNGHYVVQHIGDAVSLELEDDGERVVKYVFMGEGTKQLHYSGLKINQNIGASISLYSGKISYIRASIENSHTLDFLALLKKQLGTPAKTLHKEGVNFDEKNSSQKMLLEKLPKETKKYKDDILEQYYVSYPEYYIWTKNSIIYQLTLSPLGNYIDNSLVIISKKALKDRVIEGFHNPEQDPILSNYLK